MQHLPPPPERDDEPAVHSIRTRGSRTAVVAAAAIALFVVAAVAKPWAGSPAAGGATATARPSARVAVATGTGPSAAPDNPCKDGTVLVSPGGEPPPAIAMPPIPLARTGRVALVVTGSPDTDIGGRHDLVLVAGASGTRTVATVMLGGAGSGWAEVRSWSPDGSMLLVAAGHSAPSDPAASCSDLFLVEADGTRVVRLTDNGPGQLALDGVFLRGGASMAFVESDLARPSRSVADLRIVPFEGPPTTDWPVPCRLAADGGTFGGPVTAGRSATDGAPILSASPDGSTLALRCAGGVTLFDVASKRSRRILTAGPGPVPAALGWSANGSTALALEDPAGIGLRSLEIGRAGLTSTTSATQISTRAAAWDGTPGGVAFAPDGTRIVAQACLVTGIPHNCQVDVFSIDVATGTATLIYARQPLLSAEQVRWLPDGSGVAISDGGAGSIYLRPDRLAAPIRSSLPIEALWWAPPSRRQ